MHRCDFIAVAIAAAVGFSASYACAQEFSARLNGFNELGAQNNETGAVLSDGMGTLQLTLDTKSKTATYTLTYSNVGTTPPQLGTVSQAHIHFGKKRNTGGILVFLCTNLGNGPTAAPPPSCPANSGTVKGTITPASVIAISKFEDALTSNTAYANIHTVPPAGAPSTDTAFPAGEIRGQVHLAKEGKSSTITTINLAVRQDRGGGPRSCSVFRD